MNTTSPKPLASLALPRFHRVNRQQAYDMKIIPGEALSVLRSLTADHVRAGAAAARRPIAQEFLQALSRAICEEYRAAATLDFAQDTEDHNAKRRVACQLLALSGKGGPLDRWYVESGGPLGIWRNWAEEVSGRSIEGGHFFPEHNPRETITELRAFFST